MIINIDPKRNPEVARIGLAAFPGYKGTKFMVSDQPPSRLLSYWDGGSRNYFAFVQLADVLEPDAWKYDQIEAMVAYASAGQVTGKVLHVPQNGTMFDKTVLPPLNGLPEGVALVEHTIFCGKDLGLRIYLNQANMTAMLPAPKVRLSYPELAVLVVTDSLISRARLDALTRFGWGGYGLTLDQIAQAKASLASKGYLNKAGAITVDGRNVVNAIPSHQQEAKDLRVLAEEV